MGFTGYLAIICLALLALDVFAYRRAKGSKKWTLFIAITAVVVIGVIVFGCLWFASPM
jgi:heme/copper-type cytochrome/quinol oxidase subunit 4